MLGKYSTASLSLALFWLARIMLLRGLMCKAYVDTCLNGWCLHGIAGYQVSDFWILVIFFLISFLKYDMHVVRVLVFQYPI